MHQMLSKNDLYFKEARMHSMSSQEQRIHCCSLHQG